MKTVSTIHRYLKLMNIYLMMLIPSLTPFLWISTTSNGSGFVQAVETKSKSVDDHLRHNSRHNQNSKMGISDNANQPHPNKSVSKTVTTSTTLRSTPKAVKDQSSGSGSNRGSTSHLNINSDAVSQPQTHTIIKPKGQFLRNLYRVASLTGIRADLTTQAKTPPIPFHSSIEVIYPPSLVLSSADSASDRIVGIWDLFVKDRTFTVILSRYLEFYLQSQFLSGSSGKSSGSSDSSTAGYSKQSSTVLYDAISFTITAYPKSTSNVTVSPAIISTRSTTTGLRPSITVRCRTPDVVIDPDNPSSSPIPSPDIVQDPFFAYGHRQVSIDAVRICRFDLNELHRYDKSRNKNNVGYTYEVAVDYLGFKKTFHLTPIDQDPTTPSYSSTSSTHTKPFLFVSSLVGNKPLITATEIVTWMRFHRRLGVDHFYLYYMYPLSHLSVEHVRALNDYVEKSNVSLSIAQWHPMFYPTPSVFKRHPRGCSQLGIIQSTLYRQKDPLFTKSSNYNEKQQTAQIPRWMLEMDIDDFIVPPCNDNTTKVDEPELYQHNNHHLHLDHHNLTSDEVHLSQGDLQEDEVRNSSVIIYTDSRQFKLGNCKSRSDLASFFRNIYQTVQELKRQSKPGDRHSLPTKILSAVRFDNSYFYMLNSSINTAIAKLENTSTTTSTHAFANAPLPHHPHPHPTSHHGFKFRKVKDWANYMIKNIQNVTLEEFNAAIIVHETDMKPFAHRPKLALNVDDVMLSGPHQLYSCRSKHCMYKYAGIYLHFLQQSIGRGIDMISRPKQSSMHELLSGLESTKSLDY